MTDGPILSGAGAVNEPHREKYVVAVFSTNRFDGARIAGVTHSVADAPAGRPDIVKSIEFDPRSFARDMLAKAMQVPRNAGGLPLLVRVPSAEQEADEQGAMDMREWRHGFAEDLVDIQGADHSALDADGILIVLPAPPPVDRNATQDPLRNGEAIAARYSLWLLQLLIELQAVREERRASHGRAPVIPVAFAVPGAEDRVGKGPHNIFAREADLFRLVIGDVGVFALGDDRRDGLKIVKYFADRLSSPSSAIVWSSPADAVLAHTPAIAFRLGRRRRRIRRAAAAVAMLGAAAFGYDWAAHRLGPEASQPSVETAAHVALSAALDRTSGISDRVRRARLAEALELCKRPAARCQMEDVLRVGNELRRLRDIE